MIKKLNILLLLCLATLFSTQKSLQASHKLKMEKSILLNNQVENFAVLERIKQVEGCLLPAITLKGDNLPKKNLLQQMEALGVPAISIAVINNGELEWAKAYGFLKTGSNQKVNVETLFQAGSVSKPVASLGILSLVEADKIGLDEDVNDKLISWKIPENKYTRLKKVTLRHLLSHSSGCNVIGFDGYYQQDALPSLLQILKGEKPANNPSVRVEFVPGSKLSYSGGGYCVAQQVVEDIAKRPFTSFMQSTILDPIGMKNSTFEFPLPKQFEKNAAVAHPGNGEAMQDHWKSYPESAAAGLWSTPSDLAKFLIEIQNGLLEIVDKPILNKTTLESMVTPQIAPYGLGSVVNGGQENLEISHKGRTDGFACGYVSFPYLKQGAVVMINADNGASLIDEILRGIALVYSWPSYQVKTRNSIPVSAEILKKYSGRYGTSDQPNDIYDIMIFEKEKKLFANIGSATKPYQLHMESNNHFFLLETGYDLIFSEEEDSITGFNIIIQAGFDRQYRKFK